MDGRSFQFALTQATDCGNYSRTVAALLSLEPCAVLVNRTARETHLVKVLTEALRDAGLPEPLFADRAHFDEVEGQSLLEQAHVSGLQSSEFSAKFVVCAAFAALWRFVQSSMEVALQPRAVRVTFAVPSDTLLMDSSTARLLELTASASQGHDRGVTVCSLFSCRTPGGARLLRQSLLQPFACKAQIQLRQDAVEAMLSNQALFQDLQVHLPAIGDVDLLAARLTTEPTTRGPQWCKAAIRTALKLRQALAALPAIAEALQIPRLESSAPLLVEARSALERARFPGIVQELDRVLESQPPPKLGGQGSMAHAALMYAVRPSVNALLDIARQTWSDALEQIHGLHRAYVVKYPELNVRLEYTERRGWYLSHAAQDVPPEFLRTVQKGGSCLRHISTTRELSSENFKLRQSEREILTQTAAVLIGLYEALRTEAHLLYEVSNAGSTLDLLQAFTGYTLLLGDHARPEFSEAPSAPVAIKGGRHPLMERILSQGPVAGRFEPLDFFVGPACHFQVVTGRNGGGKSTYLQTLAQLVVLAHVGCFIPAKYAQLPVLTALFTRIGSSDSIEATASTFLVEMQEAAHILSDTVPRSLVLIDELGRGTAHADGVAICWAVCERLIEMRVPTLFATHFFEICRLQAVFPGLRNMHLQGSDGVAAVAGCRGGGAPGAAVAAEGGGGAGPRFVVCHVTSLDELLAQPDTRYGLGAADRAGLPKKLLSRAYEMASKADRRLAVQLPYRGGGGGCRAADGSGAERRPGQPGAASKELQDALGTARQLLALAQGTSLEPAAAAQILRRLQRPWLPPRKPQDAAAAASARGRSKAA